jgi:hypothetical protein
MTSSLIFSFACRAGIHGLQEEQGGGEFVR